MTFDEVCKRWQLPPQLVAEITASLFPTDVATSVNDDRSEAYVASACRLETSRIGVRSFRNNVGVLKNEEGRPVRYGLGNESERVNKVIKSSDDICCYPYVVRPQDVGRTLGIFLGFEYKKPNWVYSGKGREQAQSNWQACINSLGGVALFATCPQDIIDRLDNSGLLLPEQLQGLAR